METQSNAACDAELIKKFVLGDVRAFEEVVAKHQKPVVNFIYRMMGNFQEAEDIAQEVFIRVYQSAYTYAGRSSFVTWLFKIASNLCFDRLRSGSRGELIYLDAEKEEIQERLLGADATLSPQELVENSELAHFIETAMGKLTAKNRQAIVLREYHGFSYKDIAETAGCSVAAVRCRIYAARQQLKREISLLLD